MQALSGVVLVVGGLLVYFLWLISVAATDLLKELKALRFQLQETFTPEDLDKGHYGHPQATRKLVENVLRELQRNRSQS